MKTAEEYLKTEHSFNPSEIREFRGDRLAEIMKAYAKEACKEHTEKLIKIMYGKSGLCDEKDFKDCSQCQDMYKELRDVLMSEFE